VDPNILMLFCFYRSCSGATGRGGIEDRSSLYGRFSKPAVSDGGDSYSEFELLHLAIEADALYRGLQFTNLTGSAKTGEWDFPVVAKYKLLKGPIKPYIEGGLDFSHLSDAKNFVVANHTSNFGIVLGAGVEIHALVMRISPEIRYEGDALKNFSGVINSNRNQLAFLVGIGF
jgi:hypothetical protein